MLLNQILCTFEGKVMSEGCSKSLWRKYIKYCVLCIFEGKKSYQTSDINLVHEGNMLLNQKLCTFEGKKVKSEGHFNPWGKKYVAESNNVYFWRKIVTSEGHSNGSREKYYVLYQMLFILKENVISEVALMVHGGKSLLFLEKWDHTTLWYCSTHFLNHHTLSWYF